MISDLGRFKGKIIYNDSKQRLITSTFQLLFFAMLMFYSFNYRIPSPNKENIAKLMPDKKFPAEHPYSSHSSRFSLFPQFDTPTDMYKGKPHHIFQPTLPPETPAAVADTKVLGKSRGTPARHEQVAAPMSSARSPLRWIDGPNFFQVIVHLFCGLTVQQSCMAAIGAFML